MSLPRSTPEAQGVSSAGLLNFLESVTLHSLMIVRHGHVIAEGWWSPYSAERPHLLYSLSKSFASTAAGLAIAEGRLSLDDKVIAFFPDDLPETVSENLAAMRVHDLLAMATGHDTDATSALGSDPNWVRVFLAQPVQHTPGTHFVYNSLATYLVAAIVEKVTGEGLLAYLTPRLLEPLGITHAVWDTSPQGVAVGGWGLSVTTEAIARFGQLYLQKGVWDGKRLLPEAWVEAATAVQVANGDRPESDWAQGYGYQFWRCRNGAYRGDGAFGQYCVVLPEQDTVVAITSYVDDMQGVLNTLWEHVLPALAGVGGEANEALTERLASLALPQPVGATTSEQAVQTAGITYRFDENTLGLTSVRAEFDTDGGATITVGEGDQVHTFLVGSTTWREGVSTLWPVQRTQQPTMAVGAWTDPNTYTAAVCYVETPFTVTLTLHFPADGGIDFTLYGRLGFAPPERPTLHGTAE